MTLQKERAHLDSHGTSNESKVGILGDGTADPVIKAHGGLHCGLADDEGPMHANQRLMNLVLNAKLSKVVGDSDRVGEGGEIVRRVLVAAVLDDALADVTPLLLSS